MLKGVHPLQWELVSQVLFWFLLIGSGSLQQGGDWNRLGTWISYRVLWRFLSHMCKHNSSAFQSTQIMITLCKNVQIEMFYLYQVFLTPGGQNKIWFDKNNWNQIIGVAEKKLTLNISKCVFVWYFHSFSYCIINIFFWGCQNRNSELIVRVLDIECFRQELMRIW